MSEFNEGRSSVHNQERSERPSIQTDNLTEHMNVKVRENHYFMITSFP